MRGFCGIPPVYGARRLPWPKRAHQAPASGDQPLAEPTARDDPVDADGDDRDEDEAGFSLSQREFLRSLDQRNVSHLKLQCNIPGVSEDRDDHQRTTDLILKALDSIRASYGSKGIRYMDVLESAGAAYLAGCFDDALNLNANVVAILTNPWRDLQAEQPEHSLFQGTMVVCQLLGENEWKVNVLWEPSAPLASWDARMRHLSEGLSGRCTFAAVFINATNQEPGVAP